MTTMNAPIKPEHREAAAILWEQHAPLAMRSGSRNHYLVTAIAQALADAQASEREACAGEVPTNWLDSLLTGPDRVIGNPPYDCSHIETILSAVAKRIRARALEQGGVVVRVKESE